MKILIISPFTPYPPDSGGRIRQWEMIKYLGERHDLTVAFFLNKGEEKDISGAFDGLCTGISTITHSGDITPDGRQGLPWPMRAYSVEPMQKLLQKLSQEQFDLLITEFIYMAQHRNLFQIPAVLHEHNIESSIFRQYAELPGVNDMEIFGIKKDALFWKATWMMMRGYESRTWPLFDLRMTVSRLDQQEMDSRCPDGKSIVADNGADIGSISLVPVNRNKTILFVGTMNYFPNVDGAVYMVRTIMPHIWQADPSIRLCIVGRNMPPQIREFAADSRIEIVSDAPDIREVAKKCSLSAVPLRLGGGTRIKILESFALGLPVVSTVKGAEGLEAEDGRHLFIRDEPAAFAAAVLRVFNDPSLADALRQNARILAEERYDWRRIFAVAEKKMLFLVEKNKGKEQG